MKNTLLHAAVSFFIGIFIASKLLPGMWIVLGSFLLVLFLAYLNRHNEKSLKFVLMLAICIFAIFEYTIFINNNGRLDRFTGEFANIRGVIISEPVMRSSYTEYTLRCSAVIYKRKNYNYREIIKVRYRSDKLYSYGDLVEIRGTINNVAGKRNPGDFDFVKYYKSKGIYKLVSANNIKLLDRNRQDFINNIFYKTRQKVKKIVYKALPNKEAAIMYGMLTGDKYNIDEQSMNAFKRSGIAHILSVSGLHIGFIVLLMGFVLKPFKLSKKTDSIVIITTVLFYVLIIGMPSPAVRAFIMLSVMYAGRLLDREYNLLTSVSFAAIIMLLLNPLRLHDPGFIISFSCMYSIAILYEPVMSKLTKVPGFIRENLALSIAVWIGITPVMVCYFNYISFVSILLNLLAVPAAFLITTVGFIGVLAGCFSHIISIYIFSLGYFLIKILEFLTINASLLPFAGIAIPAVPAYFYVLYYTLVIFLTDWFGSLYYRNYRYYFWGGAAAISIIAIMLYLLPGALLVSFLDVGQGDSEMIRTPDKNIILIDGGGSNSDGTYYYDVGGNITVPVLLHQGVWAIDTIIVSHAHDDHMEGLLAVLDSFRVKRLVLPKIDYSRQEVSDTYYELLELCRHKNIQVVYLGKGDTLKLSSNIFIDVLSPDINAYDYSGNNLNNSSLVLKLTYKSFEALFTGDAEKAVEDYLVKSDISADIIKLAHHGSNTSTSMELLNKVKPKYAIISVGRNSFGHPSSEVLSRLQSFNIKYFRTDDNGAVTIKTNGNTMRINTVK